MKVPTLLTLAALAAFGLTAQAMTPAQAGQALRQQSATRLTGQVPRAAIAHARLLGQTPPQESVTLALTLPLRDQAGLEALLRHLYTPGDPLQGRFLTPDEFTARFGATPEDYAAVADFARRSGLTVTGTHPNRLLLDVAGPAAAVERALGVRLGRYRGASGRVFRAPDSEPSVPAALAGRLAGVVGLDTLAVHRPHLRPALRPGDGLRPADSMRPADGSGPQGGLAPADIRKAYGLSVGAGGAGQAIALYELDGYNPSDIAAYRSAFGLPAAPLQNVLVDGASGAAGANTDEVVLDIEMAQALAPNLSRILVYETPNDTDPHFLDGYSRIATDDLAKQVSTSWGSAEDQNTETFLQSENTIFQQMAAQGQSVLSATGDNGAYDDAGLNSIGGADPTAPGTLSVDDPSAQPYVTGVGGTTLTSVANGTYISETTWGDPTDTSFSPHGSGGGGGFSMQWPVPSYQGGLQFAPPGRSVPDVALNADPNTGYSIYTSGAWHVYGGTSVCAPLWAGLTALVNGKRAAAGLGPVGFLNPALYQIGASAAYPSDFHDITTGDNLYYPARTGYDNATGLGTFIGDALVNTLAAGLTPAATGTVTGTVTASDTGAPLAGVTVFAVSAPGGLLTTQTTTGADGSYTLATPSGLALSLRADAYAATGGRYAGARATANVAPGETVNVSFALHAAYTFPAGLQMISAPYAYVDGDDLAGLFGLAPPLATAGPRFAAWSPSQIAYLSYPSSPVNTLVAGQGYWARFPAPSYLHYDGPLVATVTGFPISLSAGWNQIGDPFPVPLPLTSLVAGGTAAGTAAISPVLYRYDTASGAYAPLSLATDSLQPYAGYWVFAYQGTNLTFLPPAH